MRWISEPEEIEYMCKKNKELLDANTSSFYIMHIKTLEGKQYEGIYGGSASGNNGMELLEFYSIIRLWTFNGNIDIDTTDIESFFCVQSKEEFQKYIDAGIVFIAPSL